MRNLLSMILMLLTAGLLQACQSAQQNSAKADTDTAAVQDTSTTINLLPDKDDSLFAVNAAADNAEEIALGKLAVVKGKDKKVKNFGVLMVKDHTKANTKLAAIAKDKKITLPAAPDAATRAVLAKLSNESGSGFDHAYIQLMIDDHSKDARFYSDEAKKLEDPDLKAFAKKTLPILQNHLDAITAIHDSMKQ